MEEGQHEGLLQRVEAEKNMEANEEQLGENRIKTLKQKEKEMEVCEQKGEKGIDEETNNEQESTDISFPNTTVLLTHLHSNR